MTHPSTSNSFNDAISNAILTEFLDNITDKKVRVLGLVSLVSLRRQRRFPPDVFCPLGIESEMTLDLLITERSSVTFFCLPLLTLWSDILHLLANGVPQ